MSEKKIETTLITIGRDNRYTQGAINSVVQRASSLLFTSVEDKKRASAGRDQQQLYYGRRGTLTHFALQDAMTELEGGAGCYLFPCGAAAIANTILSFTSKGDHILVSSGVYEPTYLFCKKILSRMGVDITWFDHCLDGKIAGLVRPETRVVFLESPASITMEIQDVPAIIAAVRAIAPEAVIIIDNTWAAGILFRPLEMGVDISIQSGTKYLTGHADAMIGTAVANQRCWPQLSQNAYLMGQMVDADTAYIASRGLRTLAVRLNQHQENALKVARWLAQRSEVERVNHPALPGSQGHEIWRRDFTGSSGLFSFVLKEKLDNTRLAHYLDNFRYFHMAFSWGGYESLILASQPSEIDSIRPTDFSGTLIRLHIGLEHVDDLIADLADGFNRLAAK